MQSFLWGNRLQSSNTTSEVFVTQTFSDFAGFKRQVAAFVILNNLWKGLQNLFKRSRLQMAFSSSTDFFLDLLKIVRKVIECVLSYKH